MGWGSAKPGFIILIMGILGMILAAIEQLLYDNGYVLSEYITEASELIGLQIVTILIFLIAGCVLAAVSQ